MGFVKLSSVCGLVLSVIDAQTPHRYLLISFFAITAPFVNPLRLWSLTRARLYLLYLQNDEIVVVMSHSAYHHMPRQDNHGQHISSSPILTSLPYGHIAH